MWNHNSGADLGGGCPSILSRDRAPDFVWAPKAKRMHQIMQINFKKYIFSTFEGGTSPSDIPCPCKQVLVLSVHNLGAPFLKKKNLDPLESCNWVIAYTYLFHSWHQYTLLDSYMCIHWFHQCKCRHSGMEKKHTHQYLKITTNFVLHNQIKNNTKIPYPSPHLRMHRCLSPCYSAHY